MFSRVVLGTALALVIAGAVAAGMWPSGEEVEIAGQVAESDGRTEAAGPQLSQVVETVSTSMSLPMNDQEPSKSKRPMPGPSAPDQKKPSKPAVKPAKAKPAPKPKLAHEQAKPARKAQQAKPARRTERFRPTQMPVQAKPNRAQASFSPRRIVPTVQRPAPVKKRPAKQTSRQF